METHRWVQHGVGKGGLGGTPTLPLVDPWTYRIYSPWSAREVAFPIVDFPVRASNRTSLGDHCFHRNMREKIVVLEEGNLPLPKCSCCDMFVTWEDLNGRHQAMSMCAKEVEQKYMCQVYEEADAGAEAAFQTYI